MNETYSVYISFVSWHWVESGCIDNILKGFSCIACARGLHGEGLVG
jgi:hypothetical protein